MFMRPPSRVGRGMSRPTGGFWHRAYAGAAQCRRRGRSRRVTPGASMHGLPLSPRHGVSSAHGSRGPLPSRRNVEGGDCVNRRLPGVWVLVLVALALGPLDATAQQKDTLTVALPSHAPTLDPHMHFERVGVLVNINMFDSLLHRSAKLEFEPSLALSWRPLSDTTWEFKLRKGVKFHDGSTMTAEDVKFSFDRVLEPGKEKKKSPQYGNVRAIKEVKIVDGDTIHLVTDKPFPLLLERLVYFCIVPKKHIEKVGEEAFGGTATVGTGPWKLVEWKRDQHIRLEAFDQHWRGKPAFKHVVFRAIPEVATQVAELKTGGVDIIRNVNADLMPDIKGHPQTRISTTPILRVHYISLDMRSAPFDKKAARQAANYAIDKQAMIQKMMAGLGRQVATVVQPAAFGFDPSVPVYPYDAKKAQELLAQAGNRT